MTEQWTLVDLTESASYIGKGDADPSKIAEGLAEFVKAMRDALKEEGAEADVQDSIAGTRLETIDVKVAVTVEGNLAFVVKGAAEASINLRFARTGMPASA